MPHPQPPGAMKGTPGAGEVQAGFRLARLGRFTEARPHYERALQLEPGNVFAHAALYEIALIERDLPAALEHQRRMLERQTLFVERAPDERRRLLVLLAPGDFQANVPIDFLIDRRTTTLQKLFIVDDAVPEPAGIPHSDAVFTAIGHSDANLPYLKAANDLVRRLSLPVINHPQSVIGTERVTVWTKLHGLSNIVMPRTDRVARAFLEQPPEDLEYPLVVRPVDSQGGENFAKIRNAPELRAYAEDTDAPFYYVMPFLEYISPDGYYRKYRITLVDGEPFPFHLGVSRHWMVHYYTSQTPATAWMREEERRFLDSFGEVFGVPLQQALRNVASALSLEYCSVDCTIDAHGRVVVFEADPAMIIHGMDCSGPFSYRLPHAQRIFKAFERVIDRARSR